MGYFDQIFLSILSPVMGGGGGGGPAKHRHKNIIWRGEIPILIPAIKLTIEDSLGCGTPD